MKTASGMPVFAAIQSRVPALRVAGGTKAKRTVHAETRDLASECGDNPVTRSK